MRHLLIGLLLTSLGGALSVSGQAPQQAVDNAVAFARLYGVVRYFYPSDAAASLDWNRFAIHGMKQVRAAGDASALEAALLRLFGPLGPGIEVSGKLPPAPAPGSPDNQLIAWRYLGPGIAGSSVAGPYRAKRTRRAIPASAGIDGFATRDADHPGGEPSWQDHPSPWARSGHAARVGGGRCALAARRSPEPADGLLRQHGRSAGSRSRTGRNT